MLTKPELLLKLLADGKWHYSDELADAAGARFGDAVFKLKKQGHEILTLREGSCASLPSRSPSGQKMYYRIPKIPKAVLDDTAVQQLSLL